MTPEHVRLDADSDDLLGSDGWLCGSCGHIWSSLAAACACEEADDVRD